MKTTIIIFLAILAVGCSKDEVCEPCEALYYNPSQDKEVRISTNECDRVDPPGYVFIKCLTIDY